MGVGATLPELSEWTLSVDPANFEMYKIYQGNFQSLCRFSQLFQSFYGKRAKLLEEIFSSSKNAIWSISLKYQETDVQIQTFTDEN